VGDEGGFAPSLKSNSEAGRGNPERHRVGRLSGGHQIALALDPAASEFFEDSQYVFHKSDKSRKSPRDMMRL